MTAPHPPVPPVPGARYIGLLPPLTLRALGVREPDPPLVLTWWEPAGDEARIATPSLTTDGYWWNYQHLVQILGASLRTALRDVGGSSALGGSEEPATWVLVLHPATQTVWVAPQVAAQAVLHPPPPPGTPPVRLTGAELQAQIALLQATLRPPAFQGIYQGSYCRQCSNSRVQTTPTGFAPCALCGRPPTGASGANGAVAP